MYFGRGHSIPSGSVVKLRLRNGTTIDLTWGVPRRELIRRQVIIYMTRKRHLKKNPLWFQIRVSYPLPEDTKVKVSLIAREIRRKFDYSATILTHFEDGTILTRPIRGRQEKTHWFLAGDSRQFLFPDFKLRPWIIFRHFSVNQFQSWITEAFWRSKVLLLKQQLLLLPQRGNNGYLWNEKKWRNKF